MRVASLLPSATELLAALDAHHLLVARSHECDFPPDVAPLPVLTGPDHFLDIQMLARVKPDLILADARPDGAPIALAAVREAASTLPNQPRVLGLNPATVEDVLDDLLRVGEALARPAQAREALVALRERLFSAQDFINPYADQPPLAFLESTDPLVGPGLWTVQLIERAACSCPLNPSVPAPLAGAAVGPQAAQRLVAPSPRLTPERLLDAAPEFLVVAPRAHRPDQAWSACVELSRSPWWRRIPAVRAGRVAVVDPRVFLRPGPRLIGALEFLVAWVHARPELMPAGFPWRPWSP